MERHAIDVPVPPEDAYAALMQADIGSSRVVRGLMLLRGIPGRLRAGKWTIPQTAGRVTVPSLDEHGFTKLAQDAGREIVFGLMGKFWRPDGGVVPATAESFDQPLPPGTACAVWNFSVRPQSGGAVVATETRVLCENRSARRRFRCYWAVVGPFSGLIRREMLKSVRAEAMQRARARQP